MKPVLLISVAAAALLTFSGCGGGGDSETNIEDVTLSFDKTDASYDLSNYIVPDQNQTNNYVVNEYLNEDGKTNFNDPTDDSPGYVAVDYERDGTTIAEYANSTFISTYTIASDRITATDEIDNEDDMVVVRYANKGDYISKTDTTITDGDEETVTEEFCKLNDVLASKTVNGTAYENVLEIKCESTETNTEAISAGTFTLASEYAETIYFAEGIGQIAFEEIGCDTQSLNDTTTDKTCEKTTIDITTINN